MNKKKFMKPEIEIIEFEADDIILTSGEPAMVQQSLFDGNIDTGSKSYSIFD